MKNMTLEDARGIAYGIRVGNISPRAGEINGAADIIEELCKRIEDMEVTELELRDRISDLEDELDSME